MDMNDQFHISAAVVLEKELPVGFELEACVLFYRVTVAQMSPVLLPLLPLPRLSCNITSLFFL
jgi:hypothetical protein